MILTLTCAVSMRRSSPSGVEPTSSPLARMFLSEKPGESGAVNIQGASPTDSGCMDWWSLQSFLDTVRKSCSCCRPLMVPQNSWYSMPRSAGCSVLLSWNVLHNR